MRGALILLLAAAGVAEAQQQTQTAPRSTPVGAARAAAGAANARTGATDAASGAARPQAQRQQPAAGRAPSRTSQAGAPATRGAASPPAAPARDSVPTIMREVFEYDPAGRRDPFVSLMSSTELRPVVSDLRLTGVLYDLSGRRPVAIMRDVTTNAQYRVTTGMTLGRMRVAEIRPRVVVFSIEEFGLNRRDSVVLVRDTSRARQR